MVKRYRVLVFEVDMAMSPDVRLMETQLTRSSRVKDRIILGDFVAQMMAELSEDPVMVIPNWGQMSMHWIGD